MASRDWREWHRGYAQPGSPLAQRLAVVQAEMTEALDHAPPGVVRVVSACAGDGRDLLGVLDAHPRRHDVRARLVELDPTLASAARRRAPGGVEVRCQDAGWTDAFAGAVPAQLVLMCGVFGNIGDDDVCRTVEHLGAFCATGGRVIWTRHRREPDLTPRIRRWFAANEFRELGFHAPEDATWSVGVHEYTRTPAALPPRTQLFTFAAG